MTGSEVERWGLGVVQEIDSAAMHLWARWQHQELDADISWLHSHESRSLRTWRASTGCNVQQDQKINQELR